MGVLFQSAGRKTTSSQYYFVAKISSIFSCPKHGVAETFSIAHFHVHQALKNISVASFPRPRGRSLLDSFPLFGWSNHGCISHTSPADRFL
jgi:hypothetical protein